MGNPWNWKKYQFNTHFYVINREQPYHGIVLAFVPILIDLSFNENYVSFSESQLSETIRNSYTKLMEDNIEGQPRKLASWSIAPSL